MQKNIHQTIADCCLKHFNGLPRAKKPKENEWTVLSCIVKQEFCNFQVVALGTGTKCIGRTKMCAKGTILNDSHAEIICRRAFLRYLYGEMGKTTSIFNFDRNKQRHYLKPNIYFHFFTTHVPCGDAAIFEKQTVDDNFGDVIEDEQFDHLQKRLKTERGVIFRTGAKSFTESIKCDLKCRESDYHSIGIVRTKPDQNTPFDEDALKRALYDRLGTVSLSFPFERHILQCGQANINFPFGKSEEKQPSPDSILWFSIGNDGFLEVAVDGKKQGTTKKNMHSVKAQLKICKLQIFNAFITKLDECNIRLCSDVENKNLTYIAAKNVCKGYNDNWRNLKDSFGVWTSKQSTLLDFTV
ncbi:tRNA-specific adenosine deaminase 1 isoform X2 [Sitophilus oryzae]|uniref:tRNA-specific adenosine deaminase 1 n=1 Tax=Sitophilus oryzae TaxID=7048 RepID=A0A6J2YDP7_SITOR|nr:tRNA-specific adenosine deaminase 1 isoform X2 [Sitophilus oryzae]